MQGKSVWERLQNFKILQNITDNNNNTKATGDTIIFYDRT